jgi:uncharacterized protein (DUF885 family)
MNKILALLFTIGLFCLSCDNTTTPGVESESTESERADSLFEAFYDFKLRINPIEASKGGDYRYNDRIANFISDDYQSELIEQYTQFIATIDDINQEAISPAQQMSLKVMRWDCAIKKEGLENEIVTVASPIYDLPNFKLMPITQISSLQLYVSQLAGGTSVHPFKTVEDYEDWLKRVDDYLIWVDTAMENMKEGMAKGVVLPKVLTERVISQLDPFIDTPVEEHVFYQPILMLNDEVSDVDRNRLTASYREMIEDKLIPKYRELRTFMQDAYLPAGRTSTGMLDLPNGKETYDYLIRLHTSTDMTADEIFELGKKEVARIRGEMEKVMAEIGFQGDLRAFLEYVRSSPEQIPFTKPEEVIANFNAIHEKMQPQLLQLFDVAPKAGFEVRRTEAFREASASAEYVPGTKDASRPGVFYIPIPDVKNYNKFSDEALFLHEAIPGHHFQLSLQQENKELPEFLHPEGMGVFVEGWALYAESLGKELGLYEDPYQYFGMLSAEMHRAIRLVVDAGMHAKGWTREEAIQYSLENEAESEAGITSEIERYMATPGQALSYKIGQLKIRELRTKAETALGEKFDIKAFHRQVLGSGSLPLSLLEEKINGWITVVSKG